MPTPPAIRPLGLALLFIITGAVGWISSFALTMAKIELLEDPNASLSCDFSLLVQCGENLNSWQGEVFGFPNSLVGLAAFAVIVALGLAILAGARFADWFWWGVLAGTAAGFVWVLWFIFQSFWVIGKLCPWCMTMWAAMIPLFIATALYVLAEHVPLPRGAKRFFKEGYGWSWVIALVAYLIVALLAQLKLDVLFYLV